MADNEKEVENTSHANDWEVVALTASTYAAAPGPGQCNNNDEGNTVEDDEAETSKAMLMSGHFAYPQREYEKLQVETENTEISCFQENKGCVPDMRADDGGKIEKKDENKLNEIEFLVEKENHLSFHEVKCEGEAAFKELNLIEKELSLYKRGPTMHDEEIVGLPQVEPNEAGSDPDISQSSVSAEEDENDLPGYPDDAWWKKHAFSLYAQAKEANAFWSIFVAATVMGLVILRQHWQLERWQVLQLKWQFSVSNEKFSWMHGPLSRVKDVIVGGNHRGSLTRSSSSLFES